MSEKTNIAWCDSTINFWSGCTKVSPGCANCYAEERDKRQLQEKKSHWGKGVPRLKSVGAVKQALAMNRKPWICPVCGHCMTEEDSKGYIGCPNGAAQKQWLESDRLSPLPPPRIMHVAQHHRRRIFSLSLGDWLDNEVPIEWLAEMLDTIRRRDQVIWILCTKRPENWPIRIEAVLKWLESNDCKWPHDKCSSLPLRNYLADWFVLRHTPKNIILLTSVENQETADKRIPELLKIPAACRGLSLEPLLGPVDLNCITDANCFPGATSFDVLNGRMIHHDDDENWTVSEKLDWQIIGGESGSNARPCNIDWIRSLVEQGKAAGVATFVKQIGSKPCCGHSWDGTKSSNCTQCFPWAIHDKKGGDIAEWPEDLRVQQWPEGF